MAAAYAYHLAESQSCLDGNKRTGMAAALVFLRLDGVVVSESTDELHQAMIAIAADGWTSPVSPNSCENWQCIRGIPVRLACYRPGEGRSIR